METTAHMESMTSDEAYEMALQRIEEEMMCRTGSLDLSRMPLRRLPPEISGLAWLRTINLCRTGVADISLLARLTKLDHVEISFTEIESLEAVAGLSAVRFLECSWTKVDSLLPVTGLRRLETLYCWNTRIADLGPLAALQSLRTIDCSATEISNLEPLAALASLQELNCSRTDVSDLEPLAYLTSLRRLIFNQTAVKEMSYLATLTSLQRVGCADTLIDDLSALTDLPRVEEINFSGCMLHDIPEDLYRRVGVRLVAYGTRIKGIPGGVLSLSDDEDCRGKIHDYFRALAIEATELEDVRLFLLGNSGVGKTQFARWLASKPFDATIPSTHGINITSRVATAVSSSEVRLRIWDFGGQEIYHGTHALFMGELSVLLLVWAVDKEVNDPIGKDGSGDRAYPLAYWLDVSRQFGHLDSVVLVAQNKCDDEAQERRSFPFARTLEAFGYPAAYQVSMQTRRGCGAMGGAIEDAVARLRDARRGTTKVPASWLRVQRRLEVIHETERTLDPGLRLYRVLEREAIVDMCSAEGVDSPDALLDYLSAAGFLFHRAMFRRQVVLDQDWALGAIYSIFQQETRLMLMDDGGTFNRRKLGKYAWSGETEDTQRLFLSLMVSCGICFAASNQDEPDPDRVTYVAPDLLPGIEAVAGRLAARWDQGRHTEVAVCRYALLHRGLIRLVLSDLGRRPRSDGLFWHGGLSILDGDTSSRLLLEEEIASGWKGAIRVQTQLGQAGELLQIALDAIEQAGSRIGLKAEAVEISRIDGEPDAMRSGQQARVKVFVIHGHHGESREAVARTLERLGFEAIVLHERTSKGRTLMEKFEDNGDVGFAVVLLTPDDVGGITPKGLKPRARQNVVFEFGYFVGRLGRERVCVLRRGDVEIPSDLAGLVYHDLDDAGAWRLSLCRELEAAGHHVDYGRL